MKETSQKHIHRPSFLQAIVGVLLVALILSNVHLYGRVEALQTEMDERLSNSAENATSTADTLTILQQAAMMNVKNQDDFHALLQRNAEAKENGTSPIAAYGEPVEPAQIPGWLQGSSAKIIDNYAVWPCYVSEYTTDNGGFGRNIAYGNALKSSDGEYTFNYADEYRINVNISELALNPYGIFEGNIYVLYDDGMSEQSSGDIRIYIYNETDQSGYKVRIPFTLPNDTVGLRLDTSSVASAMGVRKDSLELVFTVEPKSEAAETFTFRRVGVNMIGNIMTYPTTAYNELFI